MSKEHIIRLVAGCVVLIGTALGFWLSPYFLAIPAFVGINLVQSVFTGFCPLELFLDRVMK